MKRSCCFAFLILAMVAFVSCKSDHSGPTQPAIMTPTPSVPTPTPSAGMHVVNVGQGGNNFVDSQSGTSTTMIRAGDTVMWVWVNNVHSTTSGNCCTPDGKWDSGTKAGGSFTLTFSSAGMFPYFCSVHLSAMTGTVVVNP